MANVSRILIASALTLSLATVSFAGTTVGSKTGTIIGSKTGTIVGSKSGTIIGSKTGTIIGSKTGTIIGSRVDQERATSMFRDELFSQMIFFVLGWSW